MNSNTYIIPKLALITAQQRVKRDNRDHIIENTEKFLAILKVNGEIEIIVKGDM